MKRALFLFAILLAPAQAFASCENILIVKSRVLGFVYADAIPFDPDDFTRVSEREHYRGLAHALAIAQSCWDLGNIRVGDASPPTYVQLLPGGRLVVPLTQPRAAEFIVRFSGAATESSCVLWTCEIGRFDTWEAAQARADLYGTEQVADGELERIDGDHEASIYFETCTGTWGPGSFVVGLEGGVAPWATRHGLFLSSDDAHEAARHWSRVLHRPVRVVPQRVNGALLEQALREPEEDC